MMGMAEFIATCVVAALGGWAIGATLADPEGTILDMAAGLRSNWARFTDLARWAVRR